ncbi:hypothetical protein LEMLEM_LOCUS9972 [Lemmus lemmus]
MRPVAQSGVNLSDCLAITSSTWGDPGWLAAKPTPIRGETLFPWPWKAQSEVMVQGEFLPPLFLHVHICSFQEWGVRAGEVPE